MGNGIGTPKQHTKLKTFLIDTGLWRIESHFKNAPIYGKALLKIGLEDGSTSLSRALTHDEICELLERMLEAELRNDLFAFPHGAYGPNSKRPTQIFGKTERIKGLLGKWETKAAERGLRKPSPLEDFL